MDRKKSNVWNHYSVINSGMAKCSYCSNSVSYKGGSTTNLSKHLKRKHIIQYESRKHPRINEMIEQNVDEPSKQNTHETNNDQNQPSTSINAINVINKSRSIQKSVDSYFINNKPLSVSKQKTIDEQLGVSVTSRKTVSKSILPQLYEKTREKVRNNLLNAKYISFTTDGWTSINNDSFIAVTVHFIDPEECVLKTFLLGCFNVVESHTAVNLSLFLNNCFKDWNITEKVKVAVSDNAANITSAIVMNQNWRHIPCLAHTLNLIAQSGLGEIKRVHKKVKNIVEYFKRSTKAKLKNAQKQMGYPELKLIQDVCTRWNSTYDMFQRCIDNKEPLMSTIAIIGNMDNLVHADFELIKHYCAIFKPFKEVTIELSSEKGISISKVLILIKALHLHIKK
ncbi:zinc finger BED domain-containing protein 1-like [Sipha flava]|uniref:Zinc finger BED domain-containing protein 1-like n=1 Tax=Sipha flava TaxID=143950 RepID=A0A8B8FLA0_9HEMI|nr:zinc finger BED domain-containing protein 1-like [Sipha flava]